MFCHGFEWNSVNGGMLPLIMLLLIYKFTHSYLSISLLPSHFWYSDASHLSMWEQFSADQNVDLQVIWKIISVLFPVLHLCKTIFDNCAGQRVAYYLKKIKNRGKHTSYMFCIMFKNVGLLWLYAWLGWVFSCLVSAMYRLVSMPHREELSWVFGNTLQ